MASFYGDLVLGNGHYLRIDFVELEQDQAQNRTKMRYTLTMYAGNITWFHYDENPNLVWLNINGVQRLNGDDMGPIYIDVGGHQVLASADFYVNHNADGTKDMPVSLGFSNSGYHPQDGRWVFGLTRILRGIVSIFRGSAFANHQVYIYHDGQYTLYQPYIWHNGAWMLY